MRRRSLHLRGNSTIDFSGYNIIKGFGTAKMNIATHNKCCIVNQATPDTTQVSFDSMGVLSSTSPTNGTTVAAMLASGVKWGFTSFYDQLNVGYSPSASYLNSTFISAAGVMSTKNGIASFKLDGVGSYNSTAVSALDAGNSFSLAALVSQEGTDSLFSVFNSSNTSGFKVSLYCDRRTQKRLGQIQNTGTTNYFADLTAQENSTDSRVVILTVNGSTGLMTAYFNGVAQTPTATYTGTYTNDYFRIGSVQSNSNPLNGHLQHFLVANDEWDATAAADITALIQELYGLI